MSGFHTFQAYEADSQLSAADHDAVHHVHPLRGGRSVRAHGAVARVPLHARLPAHRRLPSAAPGARRRRQDGSVGRLRHRRGHSRRRRQVQEDRVISVDSRDGSVPVCRAREEAGALTEWGSDGSRRGQEAGRSKGCMGRVHVYRVLWCEWGVLKFSLKLCFFNVPIYSRCFHSVLFEVSIVNFSTSSKLNSEGIDFSVTLD